MDDSKTLVIVDVQKDFYHPEGALYVPGGEKVIPAIKKYIEDNKNSIKKIVFTVDWHPYNHCSFKENGGIWPRHCVQYTEGASLPNELIAAAMQTCVNEYGAYYFHVVKKGTLSDKEEYGAFSLLSVSHYDEANSTIYCCHSDIEIDTNEIVICGLALDYCVYETLKALYKAGPEFHFSLLKDGCACIGGEEKEKEIYEALIRKGVNII